uniref:Uncharacterized protein n=1 Tax=viral metagenome TaxID=1070528 RepID=A0A6C0EFM6_9ZZZZ
MTEYLYYEKYIKYKIKYLKLLNYKNNLEGGKILSTVKDLPKAMITIIVSIFKFFKKIISNTSFRDMIYNNKKFEEIKNYIVKKIDEIKRIIKFTIEFIKKYSKIVIKMTSNLIKKIGSLIFSLLSKGAVNIGKSAVSIGKSAVSIGKSVSKLGSKLGRSKLDQNSNSNKSESFNDSKEQKAGKPMPHKNCNMLPIKQLLNLPTVIREPFQTAFIKILVELVEKAITTPPTGIIALKPFSVIVGSMIKKMFPKILNLMETYPEIAEQILCMIDAQK